MQRPSGTTCRYLKLSTPLNYGRRSRAVAPQPLLEGGQDLVIEALEGFELLCRTEGIIPALEPAHAVFHLTRLAPGLSHDQVILLGLSGRGDKDIFTAAEALGIKI